MRLVNFEKLPNGNLRIALTEDGKREAREGAIRDVHALLEWQTSNGWEWIGPDECGALTGAEIISDECERDDHGNIVKLGRVYSNIDYYQIESDVDRIVRCGDLIWRGVE